MLIPIGIAALAAARRTDESPKAGWFTEALDRDEPGALETAIAAVVLDFESNRSRIRAKESVQLLSVGAFIGLFIVEAALRVVQWPEV